MEVVYIKEANIDTIIYLNHSNYYGYRYIGNTIETIDNLNIFKPFLLSQNNTKLPKYKKYDVYLDNQTGLKHYFYQDTEDFNLLFLNNGIPAINYLGNNRKKTNTKMFNFKNRIIICTLLGLSLAIGNNSKLENKIINSINLFVKDYEPSDIEKMLSLSSNLTKEEKDYLYNEQFISDILTIVNDSYYQKNKLAKCFNNINIISYNDKEHESQAGYYRIDTPNTLYIQEYKECDEKKKGTLAHEFAHLCQNITGYNLITEASAEIITKEYFDPDHQYAYYYQVKLLRKLMEIIGSYPIWYYNFTGDFTLIEERVLPYLNEEEYQNFLNDLSFEFDNYIANKPKFEELDEILNNLYYRIYNKDIKDDEIISLIESESRNKELVRYYFNQAKINEENSYYLDYDLGTYENLSYKEAIDRGIVKAYTISYIEISEETAFKIIKDGTYHLKRNIDYHTHHIIIRHSKHEIDRLTISGTIDDIQYEEANVDDLAEKGLIDVNYSIIDRKELTTDDYENHNYNDEEIYFIRDWYAIMNENSVDYLIPAKIILPTIETRYNIENHYIKKKKIT